MEEPTAAHLRRVLESEDARAILDAVLQHLRRSSDYPAVRAAFHQAAREAEPAAAARAVLACVESKLSDVSAAQQRQQQGDGPARGDWSLIHLVVDGLPRARSADVSRRAAAAMLACCRAGHARLGTKLAAAYSLRQEDLTPAEADEVAAVAADLLARRGTAAQAITLLSQFPSVAAARGFDAAALLDELVAAGQAEVAIRWARSGSLPADVDAQVLVVEACLRHDRLRAALHAVKAFGLEPRFPDVERLYKSASLQRMVRKGLWGLASTYAAQSGALQLELLDALAAAGELAMLEELRAAWGVAFEVDAAALAAERRRRADTYLQLPPGVEVTLVADAATLADAGAAFRVLAERGGAGALDAAGLVPAVGVDVEWAPDREGAPAAPAALLQVATDRRVFVLDLLALGAENPGGLSAALAPLLGARRVYKTGVGLSSDLQKLRSSWAAAVPALGAPVHGVVELAALQGLLPGRDAGAGAGGRRRLGDTSLSAMAAALLGRPLDKSQQCSDWARRPLTAAQLEYAALDALAGLLVFRGLAQLHHALNTHAGLQHRAATWEAAPTPAEAAPTQRAVARGGGDGGDGGGIAPGPVAGPAPSARSAPAAGTAAALGAQQRHASLRGAARMALSRAARIVRCL